METLSAENITSFLGLDDVVFVTHILPDMLGSVMSRYRHLAGRYGDRFTFGVGPPTKQSEPGLHCYNNIDDEQHSTTDLSSIDAMDKFVEMCSAPTIVDLGRRNEMQLINVSQKSRMYAILHLLVISSPLDIAGSGRQESSSLLHHDKGATH